MFEFDSFNGNDDFKNPTNMIIDNSNEILCMLQIREMIELLSLNWLLVQLVLVEQ